MGADDARGAATAGRRARPRRDRRGARGCVRRQPSATSASGRRWACSPTCGSRWHSRRSRATRSACSTVRERSSPLRSATTRPRRSAGTGEARLPRYTWWDGYEALREQLDGLGRRLGGVVPRARGREPARRPGGRRARRRRLLRQEHDADHAPARLVGRARDARYRRRARADTAARRRLRLVHALHRGLPDRRARRAGRARREPLSLLVDAGGPARFPRRIASNSARRSTAATSARTSARGTAASRSGARTIRPPTAPSRPFRWSTGSRRATRSCASATTASTCPRNDPRYLRRNALVALGQHRRRRRSRAASSATPTGDDELLREHAAWALGARSERAVVAESDRRRDRSRVTRSHARAVSFGRSCALSLRLRRVRSRAPRARSSSGSSTTASPRSARISPTATPRSRRGARRPPRRPRADGRRARASTGRSSASTRRARCAGRAGRSGRSPRRGRNVSLEQPRRAHAVEPVAARGSSTSRSHVCTCQNGSSRWNAYGSTCRREGCARPPSGTRSRRRRCASIASLRVRTSSSSCSLDLRLGRLRELELAEGLLELARGRCRAA